MPMIVDFEVSCDEVFQETSIFIDIGKHMARSLVKWGSGIQLQHFPPLTHTDGPVGGVLQSYLHGEE